MNAYDPASQPLWDFGSAGQADYSALGQLGDDQFLDLLQRQFNPDAFNPVPPVVDAVDPSKISALPQPGPPPPLSADSSPSPSSANEHSSASRRQSQSFDNADTERNKRKAPVDDDDDDDDEPSHKNAKKGTTRRKSGQDETRLQKRKEQNRAAQRAFRERKEKHVKDLEDKVAQLEQKNEQSQTENTQLRELLKRLQDENVMLKQAQFTFSVPKPNTQDAQPFNNVATASFGSAPGSAFGVPGPSTGATPPSAASGTTPNSSSLDTPSSSFPADIDFGSLTSFDQTQLSLLDESGDTNMTYDFGYGTHSAGSGSLPSATPYKTIASNPMFMSFADPSPPSDFGGSPSSNGSKPAVLDLGAWGASPGSSVNGSNNGGARRDDNARRQNSFDELFGGHMFGAQSPMSPESFTSLMAGPGSTTLSPVLHAQRSPAASASNQPSPASNGCGTDSGQCPRTRDEFQQVVNRAGPSPFAPAPSPTTSTNKDSAAASPASNVAKGFQSDGSSMIMCKGASFPPTEKRDDNVEVLAAWRKITTDPSFKASNIDINELCAEFTDKARCDGTKIVLDQNGVNMILERLRSKMQSKTA
ncbi:unnamed protein product [Peniophora sp. CBMAI 1063]|nr:unnamed protein product [Peniophora sp. CBMAI 1063]